MIFRNVSPIFTNVCIIDSDVKMEVDKGSAETVMSKHGSINLPSSGLKPIDVKYSIMLRGKLDIYIMDTPPRIPFLRGIFSRFQKMYSPNMKDFENVLY